MGLLGSPQYVNNSPEDYSTNILEMAKKVYPFIGKHNPMLVVNPMENRGYAETYPIGETGAPLQGGGFNKHQSLPLDRVGVEIFKPNEFTSHDLAAEMLHIDPVANKTRDSLMRSWSPKQLQTLKASALDWQATLDEGRPEKDAIQNATDSALRGYAVGQWPDAINKSLNYTSSQKRILDDLKNYMITGAEPKKKK
jgi:hypothetical protein